MEKTKFMLEKIIKIVIITGSIMGIISTILLFRFHIENWPTSISFCPQELILFLCLVGIILSGINLMGFETLLKIRI